MNRKTAILGACMSAVLFTSVGIGATLALYTSEKKVNVHLYSGSLSASLYMTEMKRDELNDDGHYVVDKLVDLSSYPGYVEGKGVDLSVYSGAIFSNIKLVPGMTGSAKFKLYNTGDIAFNASVSMVKLVGDDTAFYDQLVISVPEGSQEVAKDSTYEFTASYEFTDLGVDEKHVGKNNNAMNQEVSFDISVLCTQIAINRN